MRLLKASSNLKACGGGAVFCDEGRLCIKPILRPRWGSAGRLRADAEARSLRPNQAGIDHESKPLAAFQEAEDSPATFRSAQAGLRRMVSLPEAGGGVFLLTARIGESAAGITDERRPEADSIV